MFPSPDKAQLEAAQLADDRLQTMFFREAARHLARALEEAPLLEDGGKIIEVPGDSASPEVIAKLEAMGVQVLVANRKKRRRVRANQRRSAVPLQAPRVFADGYGDPDYKRKQKNKAKAARRKHRH